MVPTSWQDEDLARDGVSTLLNGEAAGDLRHRGQARQGTVRFLDRLVGDGLHLARQQGVGLLPVGREVQIGVLN